MVIMKNNKISLMGVCWGVIMYGAIVIRYHLIAHRTINWK
jgi:hypothetical protein